ncbi:MAG: 2-C-methyl-D-erythritol 4-phosphate cytidylyltransferase [Dehalococcoidales bacterium]|nr:2-C-methyl-D-erythritol 4-phosphate cytidylyltransferase [Dehalococcoidales bacterium]MDP7415806.1 2-C-methyl-D-erythritol 4-phosphate cytidylyltransferase [Dehalococcoidales bacterium]
MKQGKRQGVGTIIVAAGQGERMGGAEKLLAPLGDKPLLLQTISPFQKCRLVDRVVVVVSGEKELQCRQLLIGEEWSKVSNICLGGKRRQDSVAAGLVQLDDYDWIIVHDGARPLVTTNLIERGLAAARETGAAVAAVPVKDTIKLAGDDRIVHQTPPRQNLWAIQTPQVFRIDIITKAYQRANEDVTDDASLVERSGYKVKLYMGAYDNIKITTPDDLTLAGMLWPRYER